jgi:hypothetical protein
MRFLGMLKTCWFYFPETMISTMEGSCLNRALSLGYFLFKAGSIEDLHGFKLSCLFAVISDRRVKRG